MRTVLRVVMNLDKEDDFRSVCQTRQSLLLKLKEQGDEASWREFYTIYGRMILGYALRHQLTHSEAEDVTQDVCVKLFRRILSFDYSPEQGRFRGWLKTITRHAVIDFLRRRECRARHFKFYCEHAAATSDEGVVDDERLWEEECGTAVC